MHLALELAGDLVGGPDLGVGHPADHEHDEPRARELLPGRVTGGKGGMKRGMGGSRAQPENGVIFGMGATPPPNHPKKPGN